MDHTATVGLALLSMVSIFCYFKFLYKEHKRFEVYGEGPQVDLYTGRHCKLYLNGYNLGTHWLVVDSRYQPPKPEFRDIEINGSQRTPYVANVHQAEVTVTLKQCPDIISLTGVCLKEPISN